MPKASGSYKKNEAGEGNGNVLKLCGHYVAGIESVQASILWLFYLEKMTHFEANNYFGQFNAYF